MGMDISNHERVDQLLQARYDQLRNQVALLESVFPRQYWTAFKYNETLDKVWVRVSRFDERKGFIDIVCRDFLLTDDHSVDTVMARLVRETEGDS